MTEAAAPGATAGRPGDGAQGPLGVYVHWPFCQSKCPYCDFNSHVRDGVDQTRWADALIADLTHYAESTAGRPVASLFFGGGTPSLMTPDTIARVIGAVRHLWPTAKDLEISLEANPTRLETDRLAAFKAAGVTRLSIGVQAFDDDDLARLGRGHSVDAARKALTAACDLFQEYSFDLIYARPGQSVNDWRRELAEALTWVGPHVSFYQLTIESGTPFHRGGVAAAPADLGAALYDITLETLAAHGLPAYEISNHARQGHECRHNLNTWRGWDYVGIGPGAHGRLTGAVATSAATEARALPVAWGTHQIHDPERWLAAVESRGHGTAKRRPLGAQDRATERLMMGLRLTEGIDRARFRAQTGREVSDFIQPQALRAAQDAGYVTLSPAVFAATAEGRLRLNSLLAALITDPTGGWRIT